MEPIHGDGPMVVEETPGKKAYCMCGVSEKLPYCDGAHARNAVNVGPIVVELEHAGKKAVCQCHRSAALPWCDGAHA